MNGFWVTLEYTGLVITLFALLGVLLLLWNLSLKRKVTERTRKLERELAAHRRAQQDLALLNFALNNIREAAFLVGQDGNCRFVNEEACRALGYTREELLGMSVADIDPDFPEERWSGHWDALKTQRSLVFESRHTTKDHRTFPVEIAASYFEYDDRGYSLALARDITERKEANRILRAQEEHYRTLVENLPNLIVRYDKALRRVYVNPAWEKASGISFAEVIGKSQFDTPRTPTPVVKEYTATLQKVLETGVPGKTLFPWVSAYGTRLFLDYVVVPEYDRLGNMTGVLAIGHDITERIHAEDALRRLNRELRAITSCNQVLMRAEDERALLNDICRIICEEAGYRMAWVGYVAHDEDQTVRPVAWAGVGGEYLVEANISWAENSEQGQGPAGAVIRSGEIRYIEDLASDPRMPPWRESALKRGHRSVVTLPIKDEYGEIFGVLQIYASEPHAISADEIRLLEGLAGDLAFGIVVLRTRASRKLAEAQVERLKSYLANIIDSMPSVLVGMDRDEVVTQWNRQAEEMSGIPSAQALGRPITHLFPGFSPWIARMRDDVKKRHLASVVKLPIEKEGKRLFYDLMLYPLLTNGVEGAVLRIEDVTEKARIQELMVQTEKMMSLGGLAAGMAHEINNPLGIITQAIQNIERRVLADLPANREAAEGLGIRLDGIRAYFEKRQIFEFTGSIREASIRASRIIANILRFSRRGEAALQPGLLAGVLDQALELAANDYDLKKKYDFRSIEIIRDYAPDMPAVPMVSVEMEQVLLNLLKNAAQAMIENPPDRKPRITLRLRREERYEVLEVADNGPGMAEEIRRRVFEPFFTTKEPGIGTGLGLSVSFMIVTQNHKGLMEVVSTPGNGACFVVRLPIWRVQG